LSPDKKEIDALIVGAGPVGLMTAIGLVHNGLTCRIIDKAPERSTTSKALVIFARTLEIFHFVGIDAEIISAGRKLRELAIYGHQTQLTKINFASLPCPYPFALALPQSETERLLSLHLSALGVVVERSVELVGLTQREHSVEANVRAGAHDEHRQINTAWMIGCDGAHSTVRHLLGLEFEGNSYPESFLLADVRLEGEKPDEDVLLLFAEEGVLGIFQFTEHYARIIAQISAEEERSISETLETVQDYLTQRSPFALKASDPRWISRFRISRRKVKQFRQDRIFLAGDAAHIHSPAGGQGMNTGIQDAFNLSWKLGLVAKQVASPKLLDSFHSEREPVASSVLALTDYLTRLATSRNPVVQSARSMLVPLMGGVEPFSEWIAEAMSELRVSYRRSPIVLRDQTGLLRAGDRAPDAEVQDPSAARTVRLFDLFRPDRHCLLVFAGVGTTPLLSLTSQLLQQIPSFVHLFEPIEIVRHAAITRADYRVLGDSGLAHAIYRVEQPTLFVIRPDGYIGLRAEAHDGTRVNHYFENILGKTSQ
jgi:2-polyprenyl-6-methoxyphenol hydroxylase-like FAD-dependent oxidoreductase